MTYLLIVISFYGPPIRVDEMKSAKECYESAAGYRNLETLMFQTHCVPVYTKEAARALRK